jgi:hypothetical protein
MTDTFTTLTARAANIAGVTSVETPTGLWPQAIVRFRNGYGASVVSLPHAGGRLEIAVLDSRGDLDYSTPVTSDVVPGLSVTGAVDVLCKIASLPYGV